MTIFVAVVVNGDDGTRQQLDVDAPTFGAALQRITSDEVPEGWRLESVEAATGRHRLVG